MKMKVVACFAFLLNAFLFGTYYSVAKEALGRIDPIVFTFFVMASLVPVGLVIVIRSWKHITRAAVKSGFVLGSCLCLGLCTLAVALKYNSATSTAFFPSLNGLLAAVIAGLFLRHSIGKATWFAGVVSVIGAILLIMNASMGGLRGALIAFIGGLFCTFYVFLADHEQKDEAVRWPLFGVELLTMAGWASLIALLFGNWQAVHPSMPGDTWNILYIALGTTFLPILITVVLQKHISPVTVAFIYILEPILGAVAANLYLGEILPLDGYIGGALVVAGVLIHTWGTAERADGGITLHQRFSQASQRLQSSWVGVLGYPLLCLAIGLFVVYRLGGFPPASWRELYRLGPLLPSLLQQGQGMGVSLLIAQALSWLVAWGTLIVIGLLAMYRAWGRIFAQPPVEVPVLDAQGIRMLRQMGVTPYTSSSMKKRVEKPLVQRRRRERRERLARVELV
ncbi:MAG TPA: DMT family transporter, partial [Ktedonobacteraceae bacterium]|nr:DMT family transporter [Ktedonobacteraceae bacterium]